MRVIRRPCQNLLCFIRGFHFPCLEKEQGHVVQKLDPHRLGLTLVSYNVTALRAWKKHALPKLSFVDFSCLPTRALTLFMWCHRKQHGLCWILDDEVWISNYQRHVFLYKHIKHMAIQKVYSEVLYGSHCFAKLFQHRCTATIML